MFGIKYSVWCYGSTRLFFISDLSSYVAKKNVEVLRNIFMNLFLLIVKKKEEEVRCNMWGCFFMWFIIFLGEYLVFKK